MSIRKAVFSLSLALPLALAGCPTTNDPGTVAVCTVNGDCAESELCHPIGKICVPTCTEASDCPDTQNDCAVLKDDKGNALTTEMVCQCKVGQNALCNGDDTTLDLVCSPIDNVCENKCTANEDCADFSPSRECVGGICTPPAVCTANSCTNPNASKCGTDGKCQACTQDADCQHIGAGMECSSGVCGVPACSTTNPVPGSAGGPDICAYGETCNAGTCAAIPAASCAGAGHHTWNTGAKGIVIYAINTVYSATSTDGTNGTEAQCGDKGPKLEATVSFYAPNGLTYTSQSKLLTNWTTNEPGQIVFVKPNGSTVGAAFVRNPPASGAKSGTFVIGSCGVTQSTLSEGRAVFIKDSSGVAGNAICL